MVDVILDKPCHYLQGIQIRRDRNCCSGLRTRKGSRRPQGLVENVESFGSQFEEVVKCFVGTVLLIQSFFYVILGGGSTSRLYNV